MMRVFTGTNEHNGKELKFKPFASYQSKTKMDLCKNVICTNKRDLHSAYCQECSIKKNIEQYNINI